LEHKTSAKGKSTYRRWREYLIINVFVFFGIGLLSVVVFNFSIFDPFTTAFKDFTLTDLYYYNTVKNRDSIYKRDILLVGIDTSSRKDIAFLLEHINNGAPKVIALDVAFPDQKDPATDSLLRNTLQGIPNIVVPYAAGFDTLTDEIKNDSFFGLKDGGYVNLAGDNPQHSTVRAYYPYQRNQMAFTTAIIKMYDSSLLADLRRRTDKKTDIKYFGNLQNFRYLRFREAMDTTPGVFKDKIILLGYLGKPPLFERAPIDEDRFYTPLNPRLSGRSYPDMYGVVIHANILRMALDRDFVIDVPTWLNWTIAFLISWMLIPVFSKWYIHYAMWWHFYTKLVQLGISVLFVFISVWLYAYANTKLDSSTILIPVLLLVDMILFYDALVKFLRKKFNWKFHSIFFEGAHGH
jgi:CHASE2 domain-containing sensor protein